MSNMTEAVTLDDSFVINELTEVATKWKALLSSGSGMLRVRKRIENEIEQCLDLFDKYHGIPSSGKIPDKYRLERRLLNYGLDIVGKVLNLEKVLPIFKQIIETDWKAHVELTKEKRYRDHITHPLRVTAIGWWFLHREDEKLLENLADYYERETHNYCVNQKIETGGHTWKALIEYAWLACGLLHDSAYPLEYNLRVSESLRKCYSDTLRIFGSIRRRFSTARCRKTLLKELKESWFMNKVSDINTHFDRICKNKFKHAHGLLGALHHLLVLDEIHSLQGLVVQVATRAIITHHDKRNDSILADPLSLLLFVSDSLQAWQRPFLHREAYVIYPIIECERLELIPEGTGYIAEFWMNWKKRRILKKPPYNWQFSKFKNDRLERLIRKHKLLPTIVLSEERCIQPKKFFDFMEHG